MKNRNLKIIALTLTLMFPILLVNVNAESLSNDKAHDSGRLQNEVEELYSRLGISYSNKNVEISDVVAIYNIDYELIGHAFNFEMSEEDAGYAIAVSEGDSSAIVELSTGDVEHPYSVYSDSYAIYNGLFSYWYGVDENFYSITDAGYVADYIELKEYAMDVSMIIDSSTLPTPKADYTYILSSSNMPTIAQPDGFSCTPTSAAMILKYFANCGMLSFDSNPSNNTLVYDLKEYMNTTTITYSNDVIPGIEDYSRDNMSQVVSGTHYSGSSASANNFKYCININRPMIFTTTHYNGGYHSTAAYGYKQDGNNLIALVKDPEYGSNVEVTFSDSSVLEFFALYV